MVDQTTEAMRFMEAHTRIIEDLRDALAKEVRRFLATQEATSVIAQQQQSFAKESLPLGHLDLAANVIRGYAGKLCARFSSEGRARYWALIDSCAFFDDAIGAKWPYMTLEKRAISLEWARQELGSLQSSEEPEASGKPLQ